MERLSGPQAPQGIGGGLGIDEKLGDVATHILFALIAQRVELGLVGVENRAVRRSPLKADGRVLEAILALHLLHSALRVVDQAEAHPGELEQHALSAAPLDPGGWGLRRLAPDRRDTPTPLPHAAHHPAAGRPRRLQLAEVAQRGLQLGGGASGNFRRGAGGQEMKSIACVGLPDTDLAPLQGDGRPAQYLLPPLLQSARERGSHGVAGPRAPPRCEKVAPADTRSIAS